MAELKATSGGADQHRHGADRLAGAERDPADAEAGARHRTAPQADERVAARPGREVQGHGRPAAPGLRLRHVADRLRRAELLDGLSRQADAQPHPDADHRPRQPGLPRQAQRRRSSITPTSSPHWKRRWRSTAPARAARPRSRTSSSWSRSCANAVTEATTFCAAHGVDLRGDRDAARRQPGAACSASKMP